MNRYAFIDANNFVKALYEGDSFKDIGPMPNLRVIEIPDGQECSIGWSWNGYSFVSPVLPPGAVPSAITPRQARTLLLQQGLLSQVETLIAAQSQDVQIAWEYALEFKRDDPLLLSLARDLQLTQSTLDNFFIQAAQL